MADAARAKEEKPVPEDAAFDDGEAAMGEAPVPTLEAADTAIADGDAAPATPGLALERPWVGAKAPAGLAAHAIIGGSAALG